MLNKFVQNLVSVLLAVTVILSYIRRQSEFKGTAPSYRNILVFIAKKNFNKVKKHCIIMFIFLVVTLAFIDIYTIILRVWINVCEC
jgi:hypothetical protein